MKTTKLTKGLILVTLATGVLAAGCELIVDFDRTKIPVENIDSGGLIDAQALDDAMAGDDGGADGEAEASDNDSGNQDQDAGGDDAGQIQDASDAG